MQPSRFEASFPSRSCEVPSRKLRHANKYLCIWASEIQPQRDVELSQRRGSHPQPGRPISNYTAQVFISKFVLCTAAIIRPIDTRRSYPPHRLPISSIHRLAASSPSDRTENLYTRSSSSFCLFNDCTNSRHFANRPQIIDPRETRSQRVLPSNRLKFDKRNAQLTKSVSLAERKRKMI